MTKQRKFFTCMLILLLYFVAGAGNGISEVSSNMIVNGDFSKGTDEWNLVTLSGGEASFFTEKGWLCLHILKEGNQPYSIIVNQQGLYIEKGRTYMVSFNAYCKSGKRNIHVKVGLAAEPWTLYSEYKTYEISTQKKEFSFHFTMAKPTDTDAYIEFQLGTNKTDVYLDEIVVKKTGNNDDTDISSDSHTYDLGKYKIILGKQETLLNDGAFGLHYFPDNCISVLDTSPTYRIIMAAGVDTYLLEGIDIKKLTRCKKVLSPGKKGEFDNGYAGIAGVYRHENGKLYGFYHAEDHEGMPSFPTGIPGYHVSIGLAVSGNNGESWEKEGPVITSSKPKGWFAYEEQVESGVGEFCVVLSKDEDYLYIYYTDHTRIDENDNFRGVQICLARARLSGEKPLPGKWFKYYKGSFGQPGIGGKDSAVVSARNLDEAEAAYPHVVYSRYLDLYVMVFNIDVWKEFVFNTGLKLCGLYMAYSPDGINWSKPIMIVKEWPIPLANKSVSWQATLIFDEGSTQEGWLVYGYSKKWGNGEGGTKPHYMVGRRIKFKKNN